MTETRCLRKIYCMMIDGVKMEGNNQRSLFTLRQNIHFGAHREKSKGINKIDKDKTYLVKSWSYKTSTKAESVEPQYIKKSCLEKKK